MWNNFIIIGDIIMSKYIEKSNTDFIANEEKNSTEPTTSSDFAEKQKTKASDSGKVKHKNIYQKKDYAELKDILKADKVLNLSQKLAFNITLDATVIFGGSTWKMEEDSVNGDMWSDRDTNQLSNFLQDKLKITAKKSDIERAVEEIASDKAFEPIVRFIENLPQWDGIPRLATVFTNYLGAEDTPYIRATSILVFKGLIARGVKKGCKFDFMPIFQGDQEIGKGFFWKTLVGEEFYDTISNNSKNKEVNLLQKIASAWILEFPELAYFKNVNLEEIKALITDQKDKFRSPYAKNPIPRPRNSIFIGTTNELDYLTDITGNRRFLIIICDKKRIVYKSKYKEGWLDFERLKSERLQILAEALHLYKQTENEPLFLPDEVAAEAETLRQMAMESNPLEDKIARILSEQKLDRVAREQLYEFLEFKTRDMNIKNDKMLAKIMLKLGWKSINSTFESYGKCRGYVKT